MAKIQWQMVGNNLSVLIDGGVLGINREHRYAKQILERLVAENATESEIINLFDRAKAFEK